MQRILLLLEDAECVLRTAEPDKRSWAAVRPFEAVVDQHGKWKRMPEMYLRCYIEALSWDDVLASNTECLCQLLPVGAGDS
jgi:hypothetical protein